MFEFLHASLRISRYGRGGIHRESLFTISFQTRKTFSFSTIYLIIAFPAREKTKRTVSHISLSLSGWGFDIDEGPRNEVFLSVTSGIYRAQYAPCAH